MSDYYTEQLVKKRTTMKEVLIKAVLTAFTIVSLLAVVVFPFGIVFPVIMVVVDTLVFQRLNLEYEYLFVNGDLDIDKIMNKSKRKRVFSANVSEVELLAPADAAEVRQHQGAKVYDYSTRSEGAKVYALITIDKGQKKKILFEPNDTIVEGFYMHAPRKVIK